MLSLAFLLEVITGRELGTAAGLAPFFLASLAAMALARMPDVTQASRSWVIIVATTVVLAVGLGLLAGVIFGAAGRGGVTLVSAGWSHIAELIVTVIAMVIITIVTVVLSVGSWFGPADNQNETVKPIFEIPEWLTRTQQDAMGGPHGPPEFWPYLVGDRSLLSAVPDAETHLETAFSTSPPPDPVLRETLDPETRPINDLGRLLKILFGAGSGQRVQPGWRYPRENPGITEVFELYFEMLDAAMRRGVELSRSATPLEQMEAILATLPDAPVSRITHCFNAACYGGTPIEDDTVKDLKEALSSSLSRTANPQPDKT